MRKLLLVYNPVAGAGLFRESLDDCVRVLQHYGFFVSVYRTQRAGDIENFFSCEEAKFYDVVAVAGGDGTINRVVSAMVGNGIDMPLGIICAGTSNDLAKHLGLATNFTEACEAIATGTTRRMDLGTINNKNYFVNVCAAGMFSNVSHKTQQDLKNSLGRLAYYIKGLEQIQNLSTLKVRIETSDETIEDELLLFYILNSARLAGMGGICPPAKIDDGLFNFIGLRNVPIKEIPGLLIKVLARDYLDDKRILFRKDSYFRVDLVEQPKDMEMLITDVDGEPGPSMPIVVRNMPEALRIISR